MDESKLLIRQAIQSDLPGVQTCARAAYAMYLERMNKAPAPMNADFASQITLGFVYAAIAEDTLAGYVVFYPEDNHMHLENVAVFPSQSGRGIGKRLIAFAESTARGMGLQAMELYTNEAMTENQAMYSRLGYVKTGIMHQSGFNRVFYCKSLV